MDTIRSWLMGITATAMIAALAENLVPEGTVKRIVKLAGGMLMIIAMMQPIIHLDFNDVSLILTDYQIDSAGYSKALETKNIQLIKNIIEDETSAYIQDKAAELGITCKVKITCQIKEGGNPYPASAVVIGDFDEIQILQLSRLIEGDLAIPKKNQHYERLTEP